MRTFFGNTEPNCTYYEQYCIDNDYFRLGEKERVREREEKREFLCSFEVAC